jgi:hypothetical protein
MTYSSNSCPFVDVKTTDSRSERRQHAMEMIHDIRPAAVVMAHNSTAYRALAESERPLVRDANEQLVTRSTAVDAMWRSTFAETRASPESLGVVVISIDSVPVFDGDLGAPTLINPGASRCRMSTASSPKTIGSTCQIRCVRQMFARLSPPTAPRFTSMPAISIDPAACSSPTTFGFSSL